MRTSWLTLALVLANLDASAQTTDPSAVPGLDGIPVKVENRLLVKSNRVFVGLGPSVLERRDYYSYPGITASAAYYPDESYALEARFSFFAPFLNPAAQALFDAGVAVPDAQQVRSIFAVGARWSLGYGKLALSPVLRSVVHFDVQFSAHAAVAFTETPNGPPTLPTSAVNPTLLAGPGLIVRFSDLFHAQLDLQGSVGLESRIRAPPIAFGFLPVLGFGVGL
jgi:hypothetical protein